MYTPRRRAKHAKRKDPAQLARAHHLSFRRHSRTRFWLYFCRLPESAARKQQHAASRFIPGIRQPRPPDHDSALRSEPSSHRYQQSTGQPAERLHRRRRQSFLRTHRHRSIGILRAIVTNLTNRGIAQGGSTITQQLAKNAFLSQEQTLKRKVQEAMLALEIEHKYTKKKFWKCT